MIELAEYDLADAPPDRVLQGKSSQQG